MMMKVRNHHHQPMVITWCISWRYSGKFYLPLYHQPISGGVGHALPSQSLWLAYWQHLLEILLLTLAVLSAYQTVLWLLHLLPWEQVFQVMTKPLTLLAWSKFLDLTIVYSPVGPNLVLESCLVLYTVTRWCWLM